MALYRPFNEDIMHMQERGMQAFVQFEGRLLRQMRYDDFKQEGQRALARFKDAASKDDTVLLAIDFEGGNDGAESVHECGMASFSNTDASITTTEFALRGHPRKSRYCEPSQTSSVLLRGQILDTIRSLREKHKNSDIVLVGHSIHNEIRILASLDIEVEDLPICGILDTADISLEILGRSYSLGHLLAVLDIPSCPEAFHCAGNDAHFTLQALLGLMSLQDENDGRWDHITKTPLPQPQHWREGNTDWETHLCDTLDILQSSA